MGDDPARSSCQAEPVAVDWAQVRKSVAAKVAGKLRGFPGEEVDDLVQEICLTAFQKFDPSRIHHENSIYAFVQAIAVNAIKDYFKRRGKEDQRQFPLNETVEDDQHRPAEMDGHISAAERVRNIFDGQNGEKPLKKEQRELLMKHLGEEMPYEEIQEEMRERGLITSTDALRQKVHRLVGMIRQSWRNTK